MYVPPWAILSGLGALDRRELCNLLASFEATTLLAMSMDRAADILARFRKDGGDAEKTAFARRLKDTAEALFTSQSSERGLRIRLWTRMAEALDLDLSLPLSARSASSEAAGMAFKAAAITATPIADDYDEATQTTLQRVWRGVKSIRGRETRDFGSLVADQARLVARAVAEAALSGELSEENQQAIGQRVRDHIESLPPEFRDDAMRNALTAGNKAALALLVSGTSAFTVGVGVNLAGFSAYILAAQASAFIPFMSGPAVVSTLFMLANPLFTVPAVVGIGYLANRHVNGGQAAKLAAVVTVQLALRGLSAERGGLAIALNDFRTATADDFTVLPAALRNDTLERITAVGRLMGGRMPEAPGDYTVSTPSPDKFGKLLEGVLSRSRGDAAEVVAVTSLTAGDMIYNAVSIDPMVLDAADFSRSEDIDDIFQFGAFAEKIGSMAAAASAGAGNNLRGYVSEQLVAARLAESGHVVTFPDTSNNPGFDLLVDGVPFQVKCLLSLDGLHEHFSKYPNMPVYANGELAEAVIDSGAAWVGKVFYIDGFDRDIADLVMKTSLEAGEALGDLNVPYFAMAISSARNLYRVWQGRIPLSDLPFSVVMDGSVKGGLSAIGGLSGKALGLLVFGPAGALVLGGVGGVGALLGSGWTREQATRILSSEWLGELDVTTERFRLALISAIDAKIVRLEDKRSQTAAIEHPDRDWLVDRFSDDIVSLCEARHELQVDIVTLRQPSKARACIEIMNRASVHPMAVETQIVELLEVLKSEPTKASAAGKKASEAWNALRSKIPSRT
ncbi:hypothetical protein RJJ37_07250 [Rhizobium redzepovicii]|uniref:Uncharacterized protein n=1 Tax=Rhizobium redzepovicii TaxID=2867518 RepID=A0AAW8NX25_9HYPH|nr:hypothetical protein [Rhizobium redzepovicii]MDR9759429.1 hypothetical protein [Rhizobium redzepovicii]